MDRRIMDGQCVRRWNWKWIRKVSGAGDEWTEDEWMIEWEDISPCAGWFPPVNYKLEGGRVIPNHTISLLVLIIRLFERSPDLPIINDQHRNQWSLGRIRTHLESDSKIRVEVVSRTTRHHSSPILSPSLESTVFSRWNPSTLICYIHS